MLHIVMLTFGLREDILEADGQSLRRALSACHLPLVHLDWLRHVRYVRQRGM
jgi:hypothetical protein